VPGEIIGMIEVWGWCFFDADADTDPDRLMTKFSSSLVNCSAIDFFFLIRGVSMKRLKRRESVRLVLLNDSADAAAEAAATSGLVKGINALLPCLYDLEELVRWRAVMAIGILVDRLARDDMEAARVVMRRLMWNLNDESGGIGWGSPETFGEILARNRDLAVDYGRILFSYAREDGNYLELPQLQRGLLWGIGRFAAARPDLVDPSAIRIRRYLASDDPAVRGFAARIAGIMRIDEAAKDLRRLCDDKGVFSFFNGVSMEEKSIAEVAGEALARLDKE
jgi:hypothetical protein